MKFYRYNDQKKIVVNNKNSIPVTIGSQGITWKQLR